MSSERTEIPPPPSVDLFHISLATTREHAEAVTEAVDDALGDFAANFANRQTILIGQGMAAQALYTNHQLARILEAQVVAQQLLDKLTTQGEKKNED